MKRNSYEAKKVLVTGHTGFKGSWLCIWLKLLGADVIGYALDPHTMADNFVLAGMDKKMVDIRGDIRDKEKLMKVFEKYEPDYIFHLAAQPIVLNAYKEPVDTYEINIMGTINVLECMRACKKKQVGIFITTDKCYENKEQIWGYRENEALGGYDPYSSSKACAEIAIASWRNSFMNPNEYNKHQKAIASVRAGNVIGGGDWADNRIVPDCIRSIEQGSPIQLRNPNAIRPWQHVLEPLAGYLLLGEKLTSEPTAYCEGWNFGPYTQQPVTVEKLVRLITAYYGKGIVERGKEQQHEAQLLNLDISKALFKLGWHPVLSLEETVRYTVEWYKAYKEKDIYDLCSAQIKAYENQRAKLAKGESK